MPLYTFKVGETYRTIDAFDLEDALKEAGVKKGDEYELIEEEDFESMCFLSSITDDVFGL